MQHVRERIQRIGNDGNKLNAAASKPSGKRSWHQSTRVDVLVPFLTRWPLPPVP
jgi:hypothetical protein